MSVTLFLMLFIGGLFVYSGLKDTTPIDLVKGALK